MRSSFLSRRHWLLYSGVALLFLGGILYFALRSEPARRGMSGGHWRSRGGSAPVPVKAVPAERQNLAVHLRAIGTVTPLNTVTVRSRVDGQLLRVMFQEGQQVTAGQLLAEIDPVPYQIRLAQMEARQRQNQAQLQTARADFERFRLLHAQTLVTPQQLEAQQALVADREAAVAADQAVVDDARRQLAYTRIEAPISGRLGLRQVDAGNLVRAGDSNGLVVITQTRPINVVFTVPEIDLQKVLEPLRAGEQLPVEAWDRSEQTRLATGELRTVDNQIDLATGTLRLKAEFANEDERLFPNQFVNIRLRVRTIADAVAIPGAAVQYGSRGTYVYIVNEQSQATVRDIVLGPADGGRQAVTEGLKPGDVVILEGLDHLREGRTVSLVGADGVAPRPPAVEEKSHGKSGGGARAGREEKAGRGEKAGRKPDK